jgi:hypothetical protein
MRVRLAFYLAQPFKVFDWIIAGWTWLPNMDSPAVSHVEIGFCIDGEWKYFSSTNRGDACGTRWISEKELFTYPKRWIVYEDVYSDNEGLAMIDRANNCLGAKYDWLGIAGFATPFGLLNSRKNWYCSYFSSG